MIDRNADFPAFTLSPPPIPTIPRQTEDSHNCGPFVCIFARAFIQNEDMGISWELVQFITSNSVTHFFRQLIGHELSLGTLEPIKPYVYAMAERHRDPPVPVTRALAARKKEEEDMWKPSTSAVNSSDTVRRSTRLGTPKAQPQRKPEVITLGDSDSDVDVEEVVDVDSDDVNADAEPVALPEEHKDRETFKEVYAPDPRPKSPRPPPTPPNDLFYPQERSLFHRHAQPSIGQPPQLVPRPPMVTPKRTLFLVQDGTDDGYEDVAWQNVLPIDMGEPNYAPRNGKRRKMQSPDDSRSIGLLDLVGGFFGAL